MKSIAISVDNLQNNCNSTRVHFIFMKRRAKKKNESFHFNHQHSCIYSFMASMNNCYKVLYNWNRLRISDLFNFQFIYLLFIKMNFYKLSIIFILFFHSFSFLFLLKTFSLQNVLETKQKRNVLITHRKC